MASSRINALLLAGCVLAVVYASASIDENAQSIFDAKWSKMSYQETCASPEEEASSKGDLMSDSDFEALVTSFGVKDFVASDDMRHCMLNQSYSTNQDNKYTSENLNLCMPLMAPGVFQDASEEERRYASRGLLPFKINGTHDALCKAGQACKVFNDFLVNGSLQALANECGLGKGLVKLMAHSYFVKTAVEAVTFQSTETGKTDQCYNALEEKGTSFQIRGPMYGPILYINMAFSYLLGGEDYVKKFPGCRVHCETPDCEDVPLPSDARTTTTMTARDSSVSSASGPSSDSLNSFGSGPADSSSSASASNVSSRAVPLRVSVYV